MYLILGCLGIKGLAPNEAVVNNDYFDSVNFEAESWLRSRSPQELVSA